MYDIDIKDTLYFMVVLEILGKMAFLINSK